MNVRFKSLTVFGFCLLFAGKALANVSLKNGDFYIGYTDIVYSGGLETKIERVFNCKSGFKGIFGYGWGTEYEMYLNVSADDTVVVHEYGGGAGNHFTSKRVDLADLKATVGRLMRAAEENRDVLTTKDDNDLYESYLRDVDKREEDWSRYVAKKLVERRQLPLGTSLVSDRFSHQYVTRTRDGYTRQNDNGRVEDFDVQGHLVRISDANNNFIRFGYDGNGSLHSIVDNFDRKMTLTFNSRKLLEKIEGDRGQVATFRYNDRDDLIYSNDVDGNVYEYEYDPHHNMTKIAYADGTSMEMSYYDEKHFENVKTVKDRDGTLTAYDYIVDENDSHHYTVGVTVSNDGDRTISTSKYEYFIKQTEAGDEWTWRLITTLDGDRTETEYTEVSALPVVIRHNGEEARFQYDAAGHVTRKETQSEIIETVYDESVGKISYVRKTEKNKHPKSVWSKFQYDPKGNVVAAKDSSGKHVTLSYDEYGRIVEMISKDQTRIRFTYNTNSKPVEIIRVRADGGEDKITVTYTPAGEIKKVDSTAGKAIALQVTSSFQELLDIVRPAGVSLSF